MINVRFHIVIWFPERTGNLEGNRKCEHLENENAVKQKVTFLDELYV